MTARIVRCRGIAARRGAPNSGKLSSRRAARPSTPSTSTRGAANSIASGKPSSLRQISTTSGAFASVSAKSSTIAVTRSTNSCTAGKAAASAAVSLDDGLRAAERSEAVLAFTRYPERLPAGRQDVDARRSAENRRRQAGHRVDDVLAIVEQQEHPVVSEGGDQAGKRIFGADFQAEHGRNRARHQARVAERRQIDQPDAVFIAGDHALGDGEGDRGLADAAGPDDRHQALARKPRDERRHGFLAADHPRCRERQIVRSPPARPSAAAGPAMAPHVVPGRRNCSPVLER